jgi:hypothetical protein
MRVAGRLISGLNVFCSDGAVPIDNNVSEREMKTRGVEPQELPLRLTRKSESIRPKQLVPQTRSQPQNPDFSAFFAKNT